MDTTLLARAEYDTDWHVFVTDPVRGDLGYCTGTGPDEDFDGTAADRALAAGGWRVTGPWTPTPEDLSEDDPRFYAAYTAPVTPA